MSCMVGYSSSGAMPPWYNVNLGIAAPANELVIEVNRMGAKMKKAGILFLVVIALLFTACKKTNPYSSVQVGDVIQFAGIDWRVLEISDGKALILSEYLLKEMQYNNKYTGMTWAECSLREYLNGKFYDDTFKGDEKALIAEAAIETADNPWFGTPGGKSTKDRLFLLSIEEVIRYFGDSGELENRQADARGIDDQYSLQRIATYSNNTEYASWWWLRSPGDNDRSAAIINRFGGLRICGVDVTLPEHPPEGLGGVRPALWLKIGS